MENTEKQVIEWAIEKINSYDSEKKLYNLSAVVLSVLDVVCGIIAIFYTSMIVTSVIASIICGTIWGGRLIQLIKAERLAKALKVLSTASITYISVRKKRSEYMNKFKDNLKNNPLTIVFALIGAGVIGFATYKLAQLYFVALPKWTYILFAIIMAILTIILVVLLGWDNLKSAILRSAKKTLSEDGYNTLVEYVNALKAKEDEQAEIQAKKVAHDKEVEQARQIIADHEKRNEEYQKALELLKAQSSDVPQDKQEVVLTDSGQATADVAKPEEPSILSDMKNIL
ncbi:MAG: hypothetical protein HDT32_05075 [Clostridiales bacterium]|nr:hypothetical protein [Clostridiales bacterium]